MPIDKKKKHNHTNTTSRNQDDKFQTNKNNRNQKKQNEKKNILVGQISKMIVENPADNYPKARHMHRKFIINVGATNTGKTYTALQALKSSASGAYLSPLRLLALEVQDTLNEGGCPCSLTTGEEENIIEGATHVSATVEKADINKHYDVVVIDECQMVADSFRGGAWTRAILGVCADIIYLCVAPEGLEICKHLIQLCCDEFTLNKCERKVPLTLEQEYADFDNLQKGDAVVVFSKRSVLALAADLINKGKSVSVIYGALPYQSRKNQVKLFNEGKTDIVVATDAIGMGLNLPIRRIIFGENEKFDGISRRYLNHSEIKQIAGRAGRYGKYDEGFVSMVSERKRIRHALEDTIEQISYAYVPFPEEMFEIQGKLSEIVKQWQTVKYPDIFMNVDYTTEIELIKYIEKSEYNMSKEQIWRAVTIPFDSKREELTYQWQLYLYEYNQGYISLTKPKPAGEGLEDYELYHKMIDLYYSFSKFANLEYDSIWIVKERNITVNKINQLLLSDVIHKQKKCNNCGSPLPWDYPYGVCQKCYNKMYGNHNYNEDDEEFELPF